MSHSYGIAIGGALLLAAMSGANANGPTQSTSWIACAPKISNEHRTCPDANTIRTSEYCPCRTPQGECRRDSSGRPAVNCFLPIPRVQIQ